MEESNKLSAHSGGKEAGYIKSAATIIRLYDGSLPLAACLKNYFRQEKKFGSRDRKAVSALCFGYFRLGGLHREEAIETRIQIAQELLQNPFAEIDNPAEIFPMSRHLSAEIDGAAFYRSHLVQPELFLRARPGKMDAVKQQLQRAGITYAECAIDCLALPNGSKTDEAIAIDRDAVVQDRSSQRVLDPLVEIRPTETAFSLWDCCAASGGKSILAVDRFPNAQLTVSDIRASILHNLKDRFGRAGIKRYRSFIADLSKPGFQPPGRFDAVLCDVPCSGSGTWGRTPEQLQFFTEDRIRTYTELQRKIVANAWKAVKPGGYFLYVTCSVFSTENEDNVDWIQRESGLTLKDARYFKGYEQRADTLFAALFVS